MNFLKSPIPGTTTLWGGLGTPGKSGREPSKTPSKDLADELDGRDRLRSLGYVWKTCSSCQGLKDFCPACGNKGGRFEAPLTC